MRGNIQKTHGENDRQSDPLLKWHLELPYDALGKTKNGEVGGQIYDSS
jgi:hypothetical protein